MHVKNIFSPPLLAFFIFFLFSLVLTTADESYNICLNETTKQTKDYITITGTEDRVLDIQENVTCANGCSDTLQDCRWDGLTQVGYTGVIITGLLVISILGLFVSAKTKSNIFLAILPTISVLSLLIAVTDVFLTEYRAIFLAYVLVPAGLLYSGIFKEVED